jgi:hypothetical protein
MAKKSKVSEIREQIESLSNEIVEIQKNCKHPKKHRESTIVRLAFSSISYFSHDIAHHYCKKCESRWSEFIDGIELPYAKNS